MEALEAMNYPHLSTFQSYQADATFLKTTVPAMKRLSITTDPWDILTQIEPLYHQSLFLCLQLCPLQRIVYVCVGRKPPMNTETKSKDPKAKDAGEVKTEETPFFMIEKVSFLSSQCFRSL